MGASRVTNKFDASRMLGMPPERFLARHWQRRPLFVKQAFDPAALAMPPARLFELAARDDVESRCVERRGARYTLSHGPFPTPPARPRDWTVLVQGVNVHDARADAVLEGFRWLPHARLDDVMISVAADGGGVGPHFDSYDVFLLQGLGSRRWQVSTQSDLALREGLPLKILADFRPEHEYVCEPGDLLYLPPQCAHDGVALGPCTTWSVGFRAPTHTELLRGFLDALADDVDLPGRYTDAGLTLPTRPAAVPEAFVETLARLVQRLDTGRDAMALWLGEYLSTPKPQTVFDARRRATTPARWLAQADRRGVRLAPATLMLHDTKRVYINGASFIATGPEGRVLRQLADARALTGAAVAAAPSAVREALHAWSRDGWVQCAPAGATP